MRASVLAAWRGQRMRPLTDTMPKPLLKVGGKPLIVWHIERLARAGITEMVINHAWLGSLLIDTLGSGERFGAQIRYSAAPQPLATAGGLANAPPPLGPGPFLVLTADIRCAWAPANTRPLNRE